MTGGETRRRPSHRGPGALLQLSRVLALAASVLTAASCLAPAGGIYARLGWSERGLRVVDVPDEGPSWAAGLRPGDRIVAIDGEAVRDLSMTEAVHLLRGQAGSKVSLEVQRGSSLIHMKVKRVAYR